MDIHQIDFTYLKKNLKRKDLTTHGTIKVALLTNSATQLIAQALTGYGRELGIEYIVYEPDYDQLDRQVFELSSELYHFMPDFVILLRSTQRLLQDFYQTPADKKNAFAEEQVRYCDSLVQCLLQHLTATVIIGNFPEWNDGVFGNYAARTTSSFLYQLRKLNYQLMEMTSQQHNLFICDIAALAAKKGAAFSFDPKMAVYADMAFSLSFLPWLAKNLHDIIQAARGQFKKCLILDLDNTLWGGIIGDDGLEGIQIGSLGLGKIFNAVQLWVKQLVQRGIVVAICSKNSETTARAAFSQHPEMELRLEDIAVFVANWESKVDNIHYIQQQLNIGFDAMVFLDDDPVERARIQQAIPEIAVPALPEDPADWLSFLQDLNLFETASYTHEDSTRTAAYRKEAERTRVKETFANEEAFLASLQMTSEIKPFDPFSIPRIAQLSQRSNQFNLRTIRYTESDLQAISGSPDYINLSFSLEDKYGDYGLIAIVIGHREEENVLFIENWIMSCRVLKRGVERLTLECLWETASAAGYKKLVGEYRPTTKNDLVKDHYAKLGFRNIGQHRWNLDISDQLISKNWHIKRK